MAYQPHAEDNFPAIVPYRVPGDIGDYIDHTNANNRDQWTAFLDGLQACERCRLRLRLDGEFLRSVGDFVVLGTFVCDGTFGFPRFVHQVRTVAGKRA